MTDTRSETREDVEVNLNSKFNYLGDSDPRPHDGGAWQGFVKRQT